MKKKSGLLIITGFIVLIVAYFAFRNLLLNKILKHEFTRFERRIDCRINYKAAGFTGFKTIYLRNLFVVISNQDTLINADSLIINPKVFPLITGHLRLKEIGCFRSKLTVTGHSYNILRKTLNSNSPDTVNIPKLQSFAKIINSLQVKFFKMIPSIIIIRNSEFSYVSDSIYPTLYCENLTYERSKFASEFLISKRSEKKRCLIYGILNLGQQMVTLSIVHSDSSIIKLPYIGQRWNAILGFNALHFSFRFLKVDNNHQLIIGTTSIKDLAIYQKRISPDMVNIKSVEINFKIKVGNRDLELDSSSSVTLNRFSFSPFIRYEHSDKNIFTCAFIKKEFEASDLFESLPVALFTNFKGIVTKGRLVYNMKASIDLDHPDSIYFDSKLENKGFGIVKYGVTDFRIINHGYNQDLFDKDQYIKTILVSSENPDFVPLNEISPYLRNSVLTSEDGDFFYHHGFNLRAFRESIVTNIKAKRFARGGSTITMQLVKNVFLNRNKTISRKIEEALIVWIIENLHLVSKERMFEVYLNIIEWGPGIYGIKPASKFYFNKNPSELTLAESIYLSSIIPRPKGFRYTFVSNGEMAGSYNEYSKLLCNIMLKRNQITQADSSVLKPFVKLTGVAKNYLTAPDTFPKEDSLFYINETQFIEH